MLLNGIINRLRRRKITELEQVNQHKILYASKRNRSFSTFTHFAFEILHLSLKAGERLNS